MNIVKAFANFMVDQGLGTLGVNIFIGSIPQGAPDACYYIVANGGSSQATNRTGERVKDYVLSVYYRSLNAEDAYDTIQDFEELINSNQCTELNNFATIEMEATLFNTDQDLDNEDRTIGLVQVTLTVYN